MKLLIVLVILYIVYSIVWVFIADRYKIPFYYSEWCVVYPSYKKRLLLFAISGIIVQTVVTIRSFTDTISNKLFKWLKTP